jgi:hypothetical protein
VDGAVTLCAADESCVVNGVDATCQQNLDTTTVVDTTTAIDTTTVVDTTTVLDTTTAVDTTTTALPTCNVLPITCTSQGFFPGKLSITRNIQFFHSYFISEPFNCKYFHDCTAGGMSIVMHCRSNYVYYAPQNKCVRQVYDSDCVTVDCTDCKGMKAYYPYSQFYIDCKSKQPSKVFQCSSAKKYYSSREKKCVY